jgi:glycosyltransferase involved in cell wall biosynthesis
LNSIKVALISEEFPPFMFGGIGSACYDYAMALSKKGVETTVFCGKSKKISIEKVNEDLHVVRLPCFDVPPRFIWFQLQNLKLLANLLRDYSIIHVFNPQAGATSALLKQRLERPLITSIHGLHLISLKLSIASPLDNWSARDIGFQFAGYPMQVVLHDICLRKSDHIAVCSNSAVIELKRMFGHIDPSKISVVYNGINFEEIQAVKSEENQGSIVYCGRLYWAKGVTYFINALSKLKYSHPEFKAEIFGEGPLEHKLRTMISDLGLAANVKLRGFIGRKQLFNEFGKASMIVLPSLYEAQPVALLEAMACKKPIIAFNLPFAAEIIKPGFNGFLAKTGNVNDLADKIRFLLEDEDLREKMGKNGYEYVRKNHNWEILVEDYLKIYNNLS